MGDASSSDVGAIVFPSPEDANTRNRNKVSHFAKKVSYGSPGIFCLRFVSICMQITWRLLSADDVLRGLEVGADDDRKGGKVFVPFERRSRTIE